MDSVTPEIIVLTRPTAVFETGRPRALAVVHPQLPFITPENVGGKGFSLFRMAFLGLNVPLAYVLTTEAWRTWREKDTITARDTYLALLGGRLLAHMGIQVPLIRIGARGLAVRSGAAVSMPGMMDTSLNVVPGALVPEIARVFESFQSPRCVAYRQERGIGEIGTACIVQLMVPGVASGGSGVVTSIDPVKRQGWGLHGEWLPGELGQALVGGTKTPLPIEALRVEFPTHADVLRVGLNLLENAWNCPVEVEFAFNSTLLYFLQCRAVKIAKPARATVLKTQNMEFLGKGLAASPGDYSGIVGESIWVSEVTTPEEYSNMAKAQAIVTYHGGVTCHAAVVAREMGKPCVVGFTGPTLLPGMHIYVCGATGEVYHVEDP